MHNKPNRLSRIFQGYYHELMATFERTASHKLPSAKGALREKAIADFIKNWISTRFSICTNVFLVSRSGEELPNEIDLIMHDSHTGAVWLLDEQGGNSVATWEETKLLVEVKSILNPDNFKKACSTYQEITQSFEKNKMDIPIRVLFAYKVDEGFIDNLMEEFTYSSSGTFPFDAFVFLDEGVYFSDKLRKLRVGIERGLSPKLVENDSNSQNQLILEDCIESRIPEGYKPVFAETLFVFAALASYCAAGDDATQSLLSAYMKPEYFPIHNDE